MPETLRFLYRDHWDDSAQGWYSVRHRITRETAKTVYVGRRIYDPERTTGMWLDDGTPTFRLSRSALERDGYAFVPVGVDVDDPLFFTTSYAERAVSSEQGYLECLKALDLSYPCSVTEIKAAYRRLAMRAHPDRGGTHTEFLRLRAAYERALLLCRHQS